MDRRGLQRGSLRLVPHTAEWSQAFAAERERLEARLGPKAVQISHIGSTAIPGIVAKPIVDIAISISDFEPGWLAALERLGYVYKGENGIPDRYYFRTDNEIVRFHLHMFPLGNEKLRDHLLFRDYLIAHPEEARQYEALKLRLIQQFPADRLRYTEGKHDWIQEILARAHQWA